MNLELFHHQNVCTLCYAHKGRRVRCTYNTFCYKAILHSDRENENIYLLALFSFDSFNSYIFLLLLLLFYILLLWLLAMLSGVGILFCLSWYFVLFSQLLLIGYINFKRSSTSNKRITNGRDDDVQYERIGRPEHRKYFLLFVYLIALRCSSNSRRKQPCIHRARWTCVWDTHRVEEDNDSGEENQTEQRTHIRLYK